MSPGKRGENRPQRNAGLASLREMETELFEDLREYVFRD